MLASPLQTLILYLVWFWVRLAVCVTFLAFIFLFGDLEIIYIGTYRGIGYVDVFERNTSATMLAHRVLVNMRG